jgi:hypothetical protein
MALLVLCFVPLVTGNDFVVFFGIKNLNRYIARLDSSKPLAI